MAGKKRTAGARDRRAYGTSDRAAALAALAANGGNVSKTARETGVPRVTLLGWKKEQEAPAPAPVGPPPVGSVPTPEKRPPAVPPAALDAAKGGLADKLEAIAYQIADAVPGKIDKAGLQPSMVSLGIAIEKMRLLREQSTSIAATDVRVELTALMKLPPDELNRKYREALRAPAAG